MYTKSQEDNATSTLMRKWWLNLNVLMKFMIQRYVDSNYTAQKYRIENRVNLE